MCALGATCETEVREPATVAHAPHEIVPPVQSAAPPPPVETAQVATEGDPY